MCTEDRNVVERLALAGITLSASLDAPGGCQTVLLSVDQALVYMARPDVFSASYFGLLVREYETWVALDGQAMCGGLTKSGAPCRNPISGPIQLTAGEWKARHGTLCSVHGGGSAYD
jgi:hypothetical protein